MYFSSIALICAFTIAFAVAKVTITVDTTTTYQTIDGFGFSEAFGFGKAVQNAPSAQQTQALNYMFSTTEGAGLTILRNRVAADPADTIEPTSPGSPSATPTMYGNDESQVCVSSSICSSHRLSNGIRNQNS
jgi:O-glycosyl hydrolase